MQAVGMRRSTWTLVQPPSACFDTFDVAPPLGLLTLAAVLEEIGCQCRICDLNLAYLQGRLGLDSEVLHRALDLVLRDNPDAVGLTSMALESGFCLDLAALIKKARPEIMIVLGGPHFSSIAREVRKLFPWIDHVVTGEAEMKICALARGQDAASVRGSKLDLGNLPFPAYHRLSVPDYFEVNPSRLVNYESERGCIFRCGFCYSDAHWGRTVRRKQPQQIYAEVSKLLSLGFRHLFFVQDNFLNSSDDCREVCRVLAEFNKELTWNCYATLPQLTPALIEGMAESGCTEIFMGIDAVTREQKHHYAKAFFKDLQRLTDCLRGMLSNGIKPTCAFLLDTLGQDINESCSDAVETALAVRRLGCGIRLNVLSLYPGTAVYQRMESHPRRYSELKPRLLFDTPPVNHANHHAMRFPQLFPFHSTHLDPKSERTLLTAAHCAYTLMHTPPDELDEVLTARGKRIWDICRETAASIEDIFTIDPRDRRRTERSRLQDLARRELSRSGQNLPTQHV